MKKLILSLTILTLISSTAWAQPLGPNSPVPFGAIELLLLTGAGFGAKKAYDRKKENTK
jgi:hypothetical protein